MNRRRAFAAGVVGGAVMSGATALARALGVPVSFELILGTILGHAPAPGPWLAGLAAHLAIAGLIALIYGWGFETLSGRADWRVGLAFGVVHAMGAGVVIGVLPVIHPLIAERMPSPGPFMARLGASGVLVGIAVHLAYGAVVGALYGPTRRYSTGGASLRRAA